MSSEHKILVTGAAGNLGAIGRTLTELLLARGKNVRAMVRREDERSNALREMGAEVVVGDLLEVKDIYRIVEGCQSVYFGMSVSDSYLAATVNVAAVAKHFGVEAFVNMSQMTVSQMSITETTSSPQQKQHWLAEQALEWSDLPVINVRPTAFLDGFFLQFSALSIRESDEIWVPLGMGRTSPIAGTDVAAAVTEIMVDPTKHIGKAYNLTGAQAADMVFYAEEFSQALGRPITYVDAPIGPFREKLRSLGLSEHVVEHLTTMSELHRVGSYDRMTDDFVNLTGRRPITLREFVQHNADAFKPWDAQ
ncbi:uncharacterized protein YbjT (DUF2867 family) [Paraburkholderia sp. GAS199]|uniref:NAD(P)H-binding protein n=1 Tax=Paraburkholderia sp. GAS199 TaxID=3035126 RepID=UPI003D1F5F4C